MGRAAVAVALLVVLAGCNAPLGSGDTEPTITRSVTPLPVSEQTPLGGVSPPAGISPDGLVTVEELLETHRSALAEQSFSVRWVSNETAVARNLTLESDRPTVAIAGPSLALIDRPQRGDGSEYYVDGERAYRRVRYPNTTTVRQARPPDGDLRAAYANRTGDFLDLYFPERTTGTLVTRGGQQLYRLHVSTPPPSLQRRLHVPAANVTRYAATAWIRPTGSIRAIQVSYDYFDAGERIHVSLRLDLTDVGATTVDRPAWVPPPTETPA